MARAHHHLLRTRAEHFTCLVSFSHHNRSWDGEGSRLFKYPHFADKKQRFWEVTWFLRSHSTRGWWILGAPPVYTASLQSLSWQPLHPPKGSSQPQASLHGWCTRLVTLHIINCFISLLNEWMLSNWYWEYDLSLPSLINIDNNMVHECGPFVYLNRSPACEW